MERRFAIGFTKVKTVSPSLSPLLSWDAVEMLSKVKMTSSIHMHLLVALFTTAFLLMAPGLCHVSSLEIDFSILFLSVNQNQSTYHTIIVKPGLLKMS